MTTSAIATGLLNNTVYYARVKHTGTVGEVSPWSPTKSFTTISLPGIATPSITNPLNATSNVSQNITVTSSAFALMPGAAVDSHAYTNWQFSTSPTFATIQVNEMVNAPFLTSFSQETLLGNTTYYVRCRYIGTTGVNSAWSATIMFTTNALAATFAPPAIVGLPSAGLLYSNAPIFTAIANSGSDIVSATGTDTYRTLECRVYSDSMFTNLVATTTTPVKSLVFAAVSALSPNTNYWFRFRVIGQVTTNVGQWSQGYYKRTASATYSITQPTFLYPTNNVNTGTTLNLITSAFASPQYSFPLTTPEPHDATTWQIASDISFSNILSNVESTTQLTTYAIGGGTPITLVNGSSYFIRVKYHIKLRAMESPWSVVVRINVTNAGTFNLAVPWFTSSAPVTEYTLNNASQTQRLNIFPNFLGTDINKAIDAELHADPAFTSLVMSRINDTTLNTKWALSGLSLSTTYYVRIRQSVNSRDIISAWTNGSITTRDNIDPRLLLPTTSITNGTTNPTVSMVGFTTSISHNGLRGVACVPSMKVIVYELTDLGTTVPFRTVTNVAGVYLYTACNFDGTRIANSTQNTVSVANQGTVVLTNLNSLPLTDIAPSNITSSTVYSVTNTAGDLYFGRGLSMSGDGSRMACANYNTTTGIRVFIFFLNDGSTLPEATLTNPLVNPAIVYAPGTDMSIAYAFGYKTALDYTGTRLFVADANSYVVRIYLRTGATWALEASVTASDASANNMFGRNISINNDGSTLVVSADKQTVSGVTDAGAVYVYNRVGTTWTQTAILSNPTLPLANERFGFNVALSGNKNILMISATGSTQIPPLLDPVNGVAATPYANVGIVYNYVLNNGNYAHTATLLDQVNRYSTLKPNHQFGFGLTLAKDVPVAVISPFDNNVGQAVLGVYN